ncbi:MAG: hypothetical protein ACE144_13870 [Thermodesulfobacteriota bacterium]
MKIKGQSFFTLFFVVISAFAIIVALTWDYKTALVPILCGLIVGTLSFIQFIKEIRGTTGKAQIMDSGFKKETTTRQSILGAVQYFGWLLGLYLSILVIGLYPSLALFVFLYLQSSRKVGVVKSIVVAGVIVGVVYVIISQLAQEVLPDPWIYRLLS